jgi:hypothetical protein
MLQKAIHVMQVLCFLAIIAQGITFVLTGAKPARFVSLMYTLLGAGAIYHLLVAVDRWVELTRANSAGET